MALHVYRTTDYGATWQSLARAAEAKPSRASPAACARTRSNPDLLYLGTERGLWLSLDGGADWTRFEGGLPKRVAVHDVVVEPRTGDLVIATHGRGVWILDDPTPLRAPDPPR